MGDCETAKTRDAVARQTDACHYEYRQPKRALDYYWANHRLSHCQSQLGTCRDREQHTRRVGPPDQRHRCIRDRVEVCGNSEGCDILGLLQLRAILGKVMGDELSKKSPTHGDSRIAFSESFVGRAGLPRPTAAPYFNKESPLAY